MKRKLKKIFTAITVGLILVVIALVLGGLWEIRKHETQLQEIFPGLDPSAETIYEVKEALGPPAFDMESEAGVRGLVWKFDDLRYMVEYNHDGYILWEMFVWAEESILSDLPLHRELVILLMVNYGTTHPHEEDFHLDYLDGKVLVRTSPYEYDVVSSNPERTLAAVYHPGTEETISFVIIFTPAGMKMSNELDGHE